MQRNTSSIDNTFLIINQLKKKNQLQPKQANKVSKILQNIRNSFENCLWKANLNPHNSPWFRRICHAVVEADLYRQNLKHMGGLAVEPGAVLRVNKRRNSRTIVACGAVPARASSRRWPHPFPVTTRRQK